jgi:hypothetical protein
MSFVSPGPKCQNNIKMYLKEKRVWNGFICFRLGPSCKLWSQETLLHKIRNILEKVSNSQLLRKTLLNGQDHLRSFTFNGLTDIPPNQTRTYFHLKIITIRLRYFSIRLAVCLLTCIKIGKSFRKLVQEGDLVNLTLESSYESV